MPLSHRNAPTIHEPPGYTHAVTVERGRTAYIAGQVAWDSEGNFVGADDVDAQTGQVLANLAAVLADLGADRAQVAKLTVCIAGGIDDATRIAVGRRLADFFAGVDPRPAPGSAWLRWRSPRC